MDDAINHAKRGDLEFFKDALVDILLNARDSDGGTVLSIVVDANRLDCCEVISERCPSLLYHQAARQGGNTPLHIAASKGYLDILKILISTCDKADQEGDRAGNQKTLTLTDNGGQNFLHHAVKSKHAVKMVKHIVGMEEITSEVLNGLDNLGRTPWDLAVASRKKNIISCLLENDRVDTKLTVTKNLHWVVEEHNFGMMELFLKTNADFLKNIDLEVIENSKDILFKAAEKNHLLLCEKLYERCPSLIYHQTTGGRTALHHVVWKGKIDMVKFLIAAGAKSYEDDIKSGGGDKIPQKLLMMVDRKGHTALHTAVLYHRVEALKLLVEADPNKELLKAGDLTKNTALHLAVGEKSNYEIASLLIEADPGFVYGANSDGKTPLLIAVDKAELHNDREMLELILKLQPSQSKVSVQENESTALHYCVSRGFLGTIGCILQSSPESSKVPDNEGQNFFQYAVSLGSVEIVKHILRIKEITWEVLNSMDNLGRTPLDIAAVSENESMILCLHEDSRLNKKLTVTKSLNWVVKKQNFKLMNIFMETNADFLKNIDREVIESSVDDTILFKAAQENHLMLCKELYKICPSLIYHQSSEGEGRRTALHHASWKGELKMLKFLITAGSKSYNENISQKMLLTMTDVQDDTALHMAVQNHKLEAVKLLVEADPDYEYSANTSGETPIMISVREARSNDKKFDSEKIRKLLFKMPSQTMARTGENKWTLLQQATFDGDLSIIKDIIKFCPSCLDAVDNEGRNFLHIAAMSGKDEVVRLVLNEKNIPPKILNHADNNGNTPLHIAARARNEALTSCFLYDPSVNKTTVNKAGEHVLRAIKFSYDKRKAGVLGIIVDQSDLKDQREFDLVVGALIATVSFTAGITVPGGYISDGPNHGMAVFSKKVSFATFIISNTFALIFSLYAVFSHFCARRMSEEADFTFQLKVATLCTLAAIYCMMAAFIAGSFAVLANSNWLAIVVCIISCLFFIFACHPIWKIAKQPKRAASASQHKRCICFGFS